jgi:hypothetical protein
LPDHRIDSIIDSDQFLEDEPYLTQLLKVPLTKRKETAGFTVLKKLLVEYGLRYSIEKKDKVLAKLLNQVIFSWLFAQNIVPYSTIHLQCINSLFPKDFV